MLSNEIYLSYNKVPSRSDYEYKFNNSAWWDPGSSIPYIKRRDILFNGLWRNF